MKRLLTLCLAVWSGGVLAQAPRSLTVWPLMVEPDVPTPVLFDQVYTSALLKLPTDQSLADTYLIADGDTLPLRREPHDQGGLAEGIGSVLCVFRRPVRSITLLPGTLRGAVDLVSLYAPPLPAGEVAAWIRAARRGADCDKPPVVPVSVWRKGLAPPKEPPVPTNVQFIIVHHSAGSNTTTDYTEEVRNIYLLHTQNNGWNDVGYNFLLGRDGVIYEGRDGQGLMDGDNVLGAHFCGTNTGTMGICLMGNYNEVQPTDVSLTALDQLIGWKLRKEGLEPVGQALHASSNKQLNRIAGHRDGVCATECPGNNLYADLPAIRQQVGQLCSFTSVVAPILSVSEANDGWTVYPNPTNGPLTVRHKTPTPDQVRFEWVDDRGRTQPIRFVQRTPDTWQLEIDELGNPHGLLRCLDENGSVVRHLVRATAD